MTSANVVGYNNITLRNGSYVTGSGFDMITKAGMRLTDLAPTGYQVTYWQTGKGNGKFNDKVSIELLTNQGKSERKWNFAASYDKTALVWTTYWYDNADPEKKPIVAGSEADYSFQLGKGLYVSVSGSAFPSAAKFPDEQYSLEFPGIYDDNTKE